MMGQIAAVIVEYRAPSHTARCVQALLEQGVDDLYIIDNSDDGGVTYAALKALLPADERLHLEDAGSNLGFAAGVNRGIDRARLNPNARRVLVINNDAFPEPGLLAGLADALEQDHRHMVAYPSLLHAGAPMGEIYYHRWFATISGHPRRGAFRVPRGCCMMVAIDRLPDPLFDESFFMYGEEIALGWRLSQQAHALCHVPSARAVHEGSVGAGLGSRFYEERTAAAHLLLTRRLARGRWEVLLLGATRTPLILARALLRSLRLYSLRPMAALYPAFRIAHAANRRLGFIDAALPGDGTGEG